MACRETLPAYRTDFMNADLTTTSQSVRWCLRFVLNLCQLLMGVLCPVVQVFRAAMGHRRHQLAVSDPIAGQLVGDNHPRRHCQVGD